jgi:hypothetical protein
VWSVSVAVPGTLIAGDAFTGVTTTLAVAAPRITAVSGAANLDTQTPGAITLTAACASRPAAESNLLNSSTDYAQFFAPFPGTWQSMSGCAVGVSGSITGCLGAPLVWRIAVAGQVSADFSAGSFAAPTVLAVSTTVFPTSGAQGLTINGTNFGLMGAVPGDVSLTYGTTVYPLLNCAVSVAHTQIMCTAVTPGVGVNMTLSVTFFGLTSAPTALRFAFQAPTLVSLTGYFAQDASTLGGQFVTLTGTGFGPICGKPFAASDGGVGLAARRDEASRRD